MVSTFTPNIQLEEPARGDQVGVWDTPVNSNMTSLDLVAGAVTSITLNNSPIVLSGAQFKSNALIFVSTLTGSVAITFPTSFTKPYIIQNLCTGSSAFVITLGTTAAGGQVIGCKPGDLFQVYNSGGNLTYVGLGDVGSYWDYAGSSVPAWVSACTVPPYLNCDGSTFSATTYPTLATILGSTTLPDSKGRARFALDQGAARLSSAVAGFSPNTVGSAGGSQSLQSHNHVIAITDPGHIHNVPSGASNATTTGGGGFPAAITTNVNTAAALTGITATSTTAGTGNSQNVPPAYIGGLTLIRAG